MNSITIDGKSYEIDKLSEAAKAQIVSIRFADAELERLKALIATLQTARQAYAKALSAELKTDVPATRN